MRDTQGTLLRRSLIEVLASMLLWGLIACSRKIDPAVARAGGGAVNGRIVLTLTGAAR